MESSLSDEHIVPLLEASSDTTDPPAARAPPPPRLPHPVAKGHWIWFLTLSAGISGLLFGYDTASISSALLYLGPSLSTPHHSVDTWDKSMIASATSLGALFGGLVAGVAADRIGRRGAIFAADVGFFVGALWQAWSGSVPSLLYARIMVGVSVGVASLVVPLYISELAPPSHRGRLVVISVLFITLGQLVAYLIGVILSPPLLSPNASWRWVLGLGGVPAVFQAALMSFMPETPRWQLQNVSRAAASATLSTVYGTTSPRILTSLLDSIASGIPTSPSPLRRKLRSLLSIPGNRRALTIACFLQFLQQACGFNSLMYFSPTIFASLGLRSPAATAMTVAATNALSTCVAFLLIDRLGRRPMLLRSLSGMCAGLLLCSAGFFVLPAQPTPPPLAALIAILVGMVLFVASYALGLGAIPWLCQSEFFPMEVRGLGTGAATATNWFWNLAVASTFLGALEGVGAGWAFVAYAGVVGGGALVCTGIYPETKGLEMEEVEGLLKMGWGVE